MRLVICILYFCTYTAYGQNRSEKYIDANHIKTVAIKLTSTSKLILKTSLETKLKVSAVSEGEYGHQVAWGINYQDEEKITISDILQPTFENYNDKLSAHKIHAVTTTITLPKNMLVTLEMISGKIAISGHYKQLFVKSDTADIAMLYLNGDATILSKTGNIEVDLKKTVIQSTINKNNGTYISTKKGNHILLNTVLGRVLIIK